MFHVLSLFSGAPNTLITYETLDPTTLTIPKNLFVKVFDLEITNF